MKTIPPEIMSPSLDDLILDQIHLEATNPLDEEIRCRVETQLAYACPSFLVDFEVNHG